MATKTKPTVQVDGSGNAYLMTQEGPEYLGWWNPSLRQFTFENGDVWDVDPTGSVESFLASFPTAEEAVERESLQERDELADLGLYDNAGVCELCTAVTRNGSLCEHCAEYDAWMQDSLGSWWR